MRLQTSPSSSKSPSIEARERKRTSAWRSVGVGRARKWIVSSSVGAAEGSVEDPERGRPPGVGVEGDQLRRQLGGAARPDPAAGDRLAPAGERCRSEGRARLQPLEQRRGAGPEVELRHLLGSRDPWRPRRPARHALVVGAEDAERDRRQLVALAQPRRAGRGRATGALDGHLDRRLPGMRRPQVVQRERAGNPRVVADLGPDRAHDERGDEASVRAGRAEPARIDRAPVGPTSQRLDGAVDGEIRPPKEAC